MDPWQQWLEIYGPALLLYARQLTPGQAEAEDALQDAILRVWQSWDRSEPPRGALFQAVRRAAIDLGRKRQRRRRREEEYATLRAPDAPWFESPATGVQGEELRTALGALPAPQREVIVLKVWGDLTFAEIAATLEISPNTAASRYRYALAALRGQLGGE
ncbi:MAG: sigma-70 family RNA polymerase sigma factor [Victivallales bacterium]|nr:sigma-70 family RNA polymerase sigma factor [Victivallales bacterium]